MVMNAWKISNVVVVGTHMTVVRMVLGSGSALVSVMLKVVLDFFVI